MIINNTLVINHVYYDLYIYFANIIILIINAINVIFFVVLNKLYLSVGLLMFSVLFECLNGVVVARGDKIIHLNDWAGGAWLLFG